MPRVSVLMPVYNSEKYIGEAIESILNQTFKDFEFIIINDGSTDTTAEIVKKYAKKDKRIRFINNKKNQGIISVLNQGLDLCTGEYIARMDSDDISLPDRFAKQIEYMDKHPECGVLGGFAQIFYTNRDKTYIWKNPENILISDLLKSNPIIHPTVMIRNSVLKDYNIKYPYEYIHAEDYAIWVELINYTELHNIPDVVLKYRSHDNNIGVVYHDKQFKNALKIQNKLKAKISSDEKLCKVLTNYCGDLVENFYLFGFIPFLRIKRYGEFIKTKYYIFRKIPLITVKNGNIYLFEFIKIGSIQ